MGLWTKWIAIMYDKNGDQCGRQKFNPDKDNFTLKGRNKSYMVDLKRGSYFLNKGWFIDKKYFFYPIDSPQPLSFENKGVKPILDSDMFNIQLESKVARDLNRLGDKKISDLLTTKNIIIGSIILFALYLLATGKLTNLVG
jgi:hypothetical protein